MGVLFSNFLIAQKKEKHSFLSEKQEFWLEIQKILAKHQFLNFIAPKKGIKKLFYDYFNEDNKNYKLILNSLLIMNVFILIFYDNQTMEISNELVIILYEFIVLIYFFEYVLKIFAFGFYRYFFLYKDEFIIANLCIIEIILNNFLIKSNYSPLLRHIFVLKILPIYRIRKFKIFGNTLENMQLILPYLLNMIGLFLINLFIFAIIGCFLFRRVEKGEIIDDYVNFKNIFYGIMALFKMSTGDDWTKIMLDTINPTNKNCYKNYDCKNSIIFLFFSKIINVK